MNDASIIRPSLLLRMRDMNDDAAWSQFVEIYTPLVFGYCGGRGLQTTIDERDGKEVAKSLGLSVGAVYVAKSRVIARLKEEIQSVDAEGVTPPDFFV